jgi:hypothetical protein
MPGGWYPLAKAGWVIPSGTNSPPVVPTIYRKKLKYLGSYRRIYLVNYWQVVLNYLRTGELHLPTFICGPAIKNELEYWRIPDTIIERCCYSNYNSYKATLEALNQLEQDRKGSFRLSEEENQSQPVSKLGRFRLSVSLIVNQVDSSITGKPKGLIRVTKATTTKVMYSWRRWT